MYLLIIIQDSLKQFCGLDPKGIFNEFLDMPRKQ